MADLSAIIISKNGSLKIGATIASLSGWADSVHVFVDFTTTDDTREVASAAGATVHDIVTPGYVEGALEHAHRVPATRFVLRLDDDERLTLFGDHHKASHRAQLIASMENHGITHLWFRRRWMLPGDTHFILTPPWFPDPQLRLIDVARATVTWPARPHDSIQVSGRGAMSPDACIDHLDFCYTSAEARRAKAAGYTANNPGSAAVEQYYKYEDYRLDICPRKMIPPVK